MNIRKIKKNGGATINYKGVEVNMVSGYQVSKQDLTIIDANKLTTKTIKQWISKAKLTRGEYLGLWIDSGKCYIDKSVRIATKHEALAIGKKLNQLSILKWKNMECISC